MRDLKELMKLDYPISLTKDEDGTFFAAIDDLPGCMADGETPNEAVENVREAMKSWMASRADAGLEIPEPKNTASYSGKILVRMPRSLHKKLADRAAREGVSLNQYVVATLSEACGAASAISYQQAAIRAGAQYYCTALQTYLPLAIGSSLWRGSDVGFSFGLTGNPWFTSPSLVQEGRVGNIAEQDKSPAAARAELAA